MSFKPKSLAERYANRSAFWRLLAESAREQEGAPDAPGADKFMEIKALARAAGIEALVEDHGFTPEALRAEAPWFPAETAPELRHVLVWIHEADVPWGYGLKTIGSWTEDRDGLMSWYDVFGAPLPTPWLWSPLTGTPPKPPEWVSGTGSRPRLKPPSREAREALHAL